MATHRRILILIAAAGLPWVTGLPARAEPAAAAPTLPPVISLLVQPDPLHLGGDGTLSLTIENANASSTGIALTGIGFTDALPAGLSFTANSLNTSCGTISITANPSSITVSRIELAADTSCFVSIGVQATSAGTKTDSVTVTSDQGVGNTATLSIEVVAQLMLAESFGATWIQPGHSTLLKFTIANPNDTKRTAVAFTDPLPAGLRVARSSRLSDSCGSGKFTGAPGSASVRLSGATISPGESCVLTVQVTGSSIGAKRNATGPVTSREGGPNEGATATVSVARTGDRVLWTNTYGLVDRSVSFADLATGAGGGDLVPDAVGWNITGGLAIDTAAGRVYYADSSAASLPFARLDGTGAGRLTHAAVSASFATGLAIDPGKNRIYWADSSSDTISYAGLDGKGGAHLSTAGATVDYPVGVAIDPGKNRIYWANALAGSISYANLDGTGHGGDLNISGATTMGKFEGLAIDPVTKRIYWANNSAGVISYANLDGSGGGDLGTPGAVVDHPVGVAIDPGAGLIYWANESGGIEFASLDGSGGGAVDLRGATVFDPAFPALLERPGGRRAPAVSGGSRVGSVLRCSTGTWAGDVLGAFFYRAPQRFAYRWEAGRRTVGTGQRLTARKPGSYRCTVSATNAAGSANQTSGPHVVKAG